MSYETIEFGVEDRVATITLDRPDRLNALNDQLQEEVDGAIEECATNEEIRSVIIRGNGKAFSSGADHDRLEAVQSHPQRRHRWEYRRTHLMFDNISQLEKPVIAAVDGICAGGGFELALHCDFILASEDSTFGFPELNVGIIPGSGGCTRLVKEIGTFRAKEMVMKATTADTMIEAKEARDRFDLVNRVFSEDEYEEGVREFAEDLAESAPLATGIAKKIINGAKDMSYFEGRRFQRTAQTGLMNSHDFEEGIEAFAEKREPEFEGR
jgi:enoyl-CoA hydratase/carnithine racemase